ncbi:uncharacterized protein LOC62_06G008043 [Vanrija pseudolonga]|uniref:Uncharacterized protein n=1 Tax=Vanrija pseudolonga TaxID=143232 RepID=A0AAF0YHE5_9TREE|nr:hypothetical protein LOC62_06G008043 [Vanrija pseudolonga]
MPPTPSFTTPTFTIVLEPTGVELNGVELPRITGILRREGVATTATEPPNPNTHPWSLLEAGRTMVASAKDLSEKVAQAAAEHGFLSTLKTMEEEKLPPLMEKSGRLEAQIVQLEGYVHSRAQQPPDAVEYRLARFRSYVDEAVAKLDAVRREWDNLEADSNANQDEWKRFMAVPPRSRSQARRVIDELCARDPVQTFTDPVALLRIAVYFDLLGSKAARHTLLLLLDSLGASTERVVRQLEARYPDFPFTDEQYQLIFPFHN